MLQREHPGIAISVKTRQAIRTILNNARDVIHELKGGGLLDVAEAGKLESVKQSLPCLNKTEMTVDLCCPTKRHYTSYQCSAVAFLPEKKDAMSECESVEIEMQNHSKCMKNKNYHNSHFQ